MVFEPLRVPRVRLCARMEQYKNQDPNIESTASEGLPDKKPKFLEALMDLEKPILYFVWGGSYHSCSTIYPQNRILMVFFKKPPKKIAWRPHPRPGS